MACVDVKFLPVILALYFPCLRVAMIASIARVLYFCGAGICDFRFGAEMFLGSIYSLTVTINTNM